MSHPESQLDRNSPESQLESQEVPRKSHDESHDPPPTSLRQEGSGTVREARGQARFGANRWISLGSDAGELIAARGRSEPLAPRVREAPPASVQSLVRAAPLCLAGAVLCRVADRKSRSASSLQQTPEMQGGGEEWKRGISLHTRKACRGIPGADPTTTSVLRRPGAEVLRPCTGLPTQVPLHHSMLYATGAPD